MPFFCFKDVVLGENNGFGPVKDPCYLADPGSRYVCVFMMPSTLGMPPEFSVSLPLSKEEKHDIKMVHAIVCCVSHLSRQ